MSTHLTHRQAGYNLLNGHGLEIGALHQPSIIPPSCTIEYCDAHPREEIIQYFPELNIQDLVKVDYICDLDKTGLFLFKAEQFNFVILNHVIEHLANPIKAIRELFRITKVGGCVVISAPDKNFTFDNQRHITPFEHLLEEYQHNVVEVTDIHYLDFLQGVHPEILKLSPAEQQIHLSRVKARREHAHVWDSPTFGEFMQNSLELLKLNATCLFLSRGETNQFEYFSVWRKS